MLIRRLLPVLCLAGTAFSQNGDWHWPVQGTIYVDHFIMNYPDHGNSTDYTGGHITYTDHGGTDFRIYSMKRMDRGFMIYAAEDGMVVRADNLNPNDRPYNSGAGANNTIDIVHNDSLYTWYSHNRFNSCMVSVGDSVRKGQPLALVGSAGNSGAPHLHFDIHQPPMDPMDPSSGTRFWDSVIPYAGDVFAIEELMILTEKGLRFTWQAGYTYAGIRTLFQNKNDSALLHPPKIFGADESRLFLYWNSTIRPKSGTVAVEVLAPGGSVFFDTAFNASAFPTENLIPFAFGGGAAAPSAGAWTVRVSSGATVYASLDFTVGPASLYGPLFSPVAGASHRLPGAQMFVRILTLDTIGGPVTLSLAKANSAVSLVDTLSRTLIRLQPESDQPCRFDFVPIVAANAAGFTDTFFLHVVDFTKPFPDSSIGVERVSVKSARGHDLDFSVSPNPFASITVIRVAPFLENASLRVFDLKGRVVMDFSREMRAGVLEWNAASASSGVYLVKLTAGNRVYSRKALIQK